MTSFAIDPSKSKAMNVQNPYDFAGVSVSSPLIESSVADLVFYF